MLLGFFIYSLLELLPFVLIFVVFIGIWTLAEKLAKTPGWFRLVIGGAETAVPRGRIIAKGVTAGAVYAVVWVCLVRTTFSVEDFFASLWFFGVIAAGVAFSCGILCWKKPEKWFWSFLIAVALSAAICVCLVLFEDTRTFLFGGNALRSRDGEKLGLIWSSYSYASEEKTFRIEGVKEAWAFWGVCVGAAVGQLLTALLLILIHRDLDMPVQSIGTDLAATKVRTAVMRRTIIKGFITGTIFIFFWLLAHFVLENYGNLQIDPYWVYMYLIPAISVICCSAALLWKGAAGWGFSLIITMLIYLLGLLIYSCVYFSVFVPLVPDIQPTGLFAFFCLDNTMFFLQFIEIAVLVPLCRRLRDEKTALAG